MSRIFEIVYRDGAARIGKLTLDKQFSTPAIIKPWSKYPVADSGSLWGRSESNGSIIILPHKSTPLHTRKEIVEELQNSVDYNIEKSGYFGIVVHPCHQRLKEADLYVLGCARQLENNPMALVNSIIKLKENTRANSLLYTPALATPENLCMLVYMGVDMVDETLAIIKAYQDVYLTNSGEFDLSTLKEFPCTCAVCSNNTPEEVLKLDKKERAELLSHHNSLKLEEEMRIIRERIRQGTLREYVESRCRVRAWLTAVLRLLDAEYDFLEKRTPSFRSSKLYANTMESLHRVEIKRFADRVIERYSPPELDTLLLLPCSAKKPYSLSLSHKRFIEALGKYRWYVHEVIITSPLGVVPRELELVYPAAHYDTPVTGIWDREEKAWVKECLKRYLVKNRYMNIVAHVDGAYMEICKAVEKELGIDIIYTSENKVTSHTSLNNLKNTISTLKNTKKRSYENMKLDIIRAIIDYQFGKGAGDVLLKNAYVKAAFPRFQVFAENQRQLATLVPKYGSIALTLEGGERLRYHAYYVTIDNFIPHGNIMAPGIVHADPQIRPNDEVIVEGEKIFGVGKALMSGWEMINSDRGVAVQLRHLRKV